MMTISRYVIGVLCIATASAGCASITDEWPDHRSGRLYCRSLPDYLRVIRADSVWNGRTDLVVPLVIHLMDAHDGGEGVRNYWTAEMMKTYFGSGELSVNHVWAKSGIRFKVIAIEHCYYGSLPTRIGHHVLPPDVAEQRKVPPGEQAKRIADYLDTNDLYGFRGAVNLYFWRAVLGRANGYGESPRRSRREVEDRGREALSTVWFEGGLDSCETKPIKCRWRLAHELGHALGLPHTCQVCDGGDCCKGMCWGWSPHNDYYYDCPAGQDESCQHHTPVSNGACCCGCAPGDDVRDGFNLCGDELKCCGQQDLGKARLMFTHFVSDESFQFSGEQLCPGEIHSARSAVREFFPQ